MMYRRHAAQHSAKSYDNIATKAETETGSLSQFFATLLKLGVFAQAERENRQHNRAAKRQKRNSMYSASGLNGERAMARRRRQIASGFLREANGLVA
jgi:hypothetical protein